MAYFLSVYFYLIMVPFVLGVLPGSLGYFIYCLIKKAQRKEFLKESLYVWGVTAVITFIFLQTKPAIRFFSTSSAPYTVLAVTQVILFMVLPILPFAVHSRIFKTTTKKVFERIAIAYSWYGLIAIVLISHLLLTTPTLLGIILKDPLVSVKIISITELYVVFQSSLF
jgi:hypothetical protein